MRARAADGTDPVDGVSEKTWRERIATRLVAELEAKPAYAEIRVIGVDDSQREIVRVDRRGPNDAIQIVPEERLATKGRQNLFQANHQAAARRHLRLADHAGSDRPDHHHAPGTDTAGGDADLHSGRQTVRDLHHQCRHEAGLRPRPLVGASGRKRLPRRCKRRLSHSSRPSARIRLHVGQADRLAARLSGARHLAGRDGRRGAGTAESRRTAGRHRARPRHPGRQSMGRGDRDRAQRGDHGERRLDPGYVPAGRTDRGAVRGRIGCTAGALAHPPDRATDRRGRRRRPQRPGGNSGRCARRNRGAGARLRPDGRRSQ